MAVAPLSVSNSSIKVMNAALNELGIKPITAFTDNTLSARTGNVMFSDVLEEVLAGYPWRFARGQVQINRVPETAPKPWQTVWALPASALNVRQVFQDDYPIAFDVFGRKVALDVPETTTSTIRAEVTLSVSPDAWPGYFRRAFIQHLAAALCMPLTQDERFSLQLREYAREAMLKAQSRDAQARTPSRLDVGTFRRVRRARSRS